MDRPGVGIGVAIFKDGKVLLGKRKGSHGAATWAFPGGHIELGESFEDCARREVFEETGLMVGNFRKLTFTNDIFSENKHYVTLYLACDYISGELELKEPEKCEGWNWFSVAEIPHPRFLPLDHLLEENPTLS